MSWARRASHSVGFLAKPGSFCHPTHLQHLHLPLLLIFHLHHDNDDDDASMMMLVILHVHFQIPPSPPPSISPSHSGRPLVKPGSHHHPPSSSFSIIFSQLTRSLFFSLSCTSFCLSASPLLTPVAPAGEISLQELSFLAFCRLPVIFKYVGR